MKLYVCIFDDARLLPHFLEHYVQFGISEFHVAAPPHLASYVDGKSQGYNVRQYNAFDVADSFMGGSAAVTAMRTETQGPEEWVVITDLDEFVEFGEAALNIAERHDAQGCNVVTGIMYDRFAENGQPTAFDDHSDLHNLYPVRARMTKEIMLGVDRKCVLVKGHLKSKGAHHKFYDEKPASAVLEISHYKWHDRGMERVRNAFAMLTSATVPWAKEYKRVIDHYEEHGRIAWETFGGVLLDKR